MELRRYVCLLWRWLSLVSLGSALAAACSYLASPSMRNVCESSTALLVNHAHSPGSMVYSDLLTGQMLTKTYSQLILKRPVLETVIQELQLPCGVGQLADGECPR